MDWESELQPVTSPPGDCLDHDVLQLYKPERQWMKENCGHLRGRELEAAMTKGIDDWYPHYPTLTCELLWMRCAIDGFANDILHDRVELAIPDEVNAFDFKTSVGKLREIRGSSLMQYVSTGEKTDLGAHT